MTASHLPKTADNAPLRRLGVKPVINACGIYTDLGGSRLSPGVWAAMEEANRNFVRLTDLLDFSGRHKLRQFRFADRPGLRAPIYIIPVHGRFFMLEC